MGIANPLSAVSEQESGYHFDAVAFKTDQHHLAVSAHVGIRICTGENPFYLLQQRGLPIPHITLKAAVNCRRKKEVQIHIARRPAVFFPHDPIRKLCSVSDAEP